jgi:hypothetical protein
MTPRFVILKHDHPFLHWDFLLEEATSARTWRLLRKPCLNEPIAAEPLSAHRLMYLDYEGPVSNNRGVVRRVVEGRYAIDSISSSSSEGQTLRLQLLDNRFARTATISTLADGRQFATFAK